MLFGGTEFDGSEAAGGFERLAEAAAQVQGTTGAIGMSPDTIVQSPLQANAETDWPEQFSQILLATQFADGPDITELEQGRLDAARNISADNMPNNAKLNGWKPLNTKPRKPELWQAILERSSTARPKAWPIDAMVKWLQDNNPTQPLPMHLSPAPTSPAITTPVTAVALVAVDTSAADSAHKQRWSRVKFVRAIHIICDDDLKEEFRNRDRKLDRQEMDAKGKDSFWEKAAIVFNSGANFDICKSNKNADRFKNLSAAPTGFVVEASKLKYEFGVLRAALTKTLINFRKSGMGNDHEGDPEADPDQVYSADFRDFCQGDELLEYLYFMLSKHDLLDAATCDMPEESKFSSSSKRRVDANCAQPKPKRSRGQKNKKNGLHAKEIKKMLTSLPPLKLHKSKATAAAEAVQSFRQLLKGYHGLGKTLVKMECDLQNAKKEFHTANLAVMTDIDSDNTEVEDESQRRVKDAKSAVGRLERVVNAVRAQQAKLFDQLVDADIMCAAEDGVADDLSDLASSEGSEDEEDAAA
jgi:hypothetical protein